MRRASVLVTVLALLIAFGVTPVQAGGPNGNGPGDGTGDGNFYNWNYGWYYNWYYFWQSCTGCDNAGGGEQAKPSDPPVQGDGDNGNNHEYQWKYKWQYKVDKEDCCTGGDRDQTRLRDGSCQP
ncbi:MAG TPA: hypothetical protein VMY05_06110 [Acidobacteriota bacterium]|nr:hypothetical protein [Acidobacteriota bacterium]